MKRFLTAILSFLILSSSVDAAHIKGGFFTYQYLGPGSAGNLRYRITLTVYMQCNPNSGQLSNPINFSIFNAGTNQFVRNESVSISNQYNLDKTYDEPCITGDQRKCYYTIVVYDLADVELSSTATGYTIAYQRCCRIAGINNVISSGSVGNTFSINIPGTNIGNNATTNSSPTFLVNDTAVVCTNSFFQYSFQATDINTEDSLSYEFCAPFLGGDNGNGSAPPTATNPPYTTIPYQSPYSGTQPMGASVTINPVTGLISGIAPGATGQYVVSVCVSEWRQGVLIAKTRKELHVEVNDCQPLNAQLDPKPATCDGFTLNFQNDVTNPAGAQYLWTFGDPASGSLDTSILETPTHTYIDTGVYIVKLRVSLAGGLCADSATFLARIFPGFVPQFTAAGGCFTNPFQFTDITNPTYGVVNSWRWNFGDGSTVADTSRIRNPQWTYSSAGVKDVSMIVTSSKGCVDTIQAPVTIFDKPPITLAFKDTLICRPDAVQLNATGNGNFSWTPLTNIVNANTGTPTVNPITTTWYYVRLDDMGCINNDSLRVRVVSFVTLNAMADTTICRTDNVQLNANTDGLQFTWTPAATINNPTIVNPFATPVLASTTYTLLARIGSCTATDDVTITTVPYPIADAGPLQTICYNTSAQLNGSHDGSSFFWSPTSYLNNPAILNPISSPPRTTQYVLSSFDTRGCPKPGRDTIIVTVLPRVRAFAGRDTSVVVGQPLQFTGTGGISYVWSPSTGLSNVNIFNPVGVYTSETDSITYKLVVRDAANCADSAFVTVKVFQTNPYVFVPTAFTPNNDGKNDVIRPIAVGMSRINYFSIYNRWGQLVFSTTINGKGWDGRIKGVLQSTNVFVWMVNAIDYTGKKFFLKGTVALIR
jgi:gliding motility-associated-like protein